MIGWSPGTGWSVENKVQSVILLFVCDAILHAMARGLKVHLLTFEWNVPA